MDPTLIIAGAMALLKPLLEKAGEKAAETIGEKLAEKTVEKDFWQKVKRLFILPEEKAVIEGIEKKPIATPQEIMMIEEKLSKEAVANPQFASEMQSTLNLTSTNMFIAEQLLKSLQKDKKKLAELMDDKRLAGVGNEDQYALEIRRVTRRMTKDEKEFISLINNK